MTASEALTTLANAADVSSQRASVISLVKSKQLNKVAGDLLFLQALDRLADSARDANQQDRLLAVATLERTAAVAKSLRSRVNQLLETAVSTPLVDLADLEDKHDRLYAAKSWRAVRGSWYPEFLAKVAVQEESAENVRAECLAGIVALSKDTDDAIETLRAAINRLEFETKKPGDSLARRLTRIFSALAKAISVSHKSVTPKTGRTLGRLIETTAKRIGRPETFPVKMELAVTVADLVHEIVRSEFSQSVDGRMYEPLMVLQEWFEYGDWKDLCESSEAMVRVNGDVRQALIIDVRHGVQNDYLRTAMVTVSGSPEAARFTCETLATTLSGISTHMKEWLVGAPARRRSLAAEESQERSVDEILGEVLLELERLRDATRVVTSHVLPDVSTVLPRSARGLTRLTGAAETIINKLDLALEYRSLQIRGRLGDEVEFSPTEHEFVADGPRTRRVKIVRPLVERVGRDGLRRVVRRARVEPVADRRS